MKKEYLKAEEELLAFTKTDVKRFLKQTPNKMFNDDEALKKSEERLNAFINK